MAFSELRSVVDEDGETQNTIDSSQSSTFFRSQITRLNAGVTPGPNVSIKAPSRKMFQSDSHSTLAPLKANLSESVTEEQLLVQQLKKIRKYKTIELLIMFLGVREYQQAHAAH